MSDRLKVKVNFKRHHCEIFDAKAIMIITRCLGGLLLVYKVAVPIFCISWDFWTIITLGTTIGSIFTSDLWELWFFLDLSRIPNQMISEKNVVMNEMKITAGWLIIATWIRRTFKHSKASGWCVFQNGMLWDHWRQKHRLLPAYSGSGWEGLWIELNIF